MPAETLGTVEKMAAADKINDFMLKVVLIARVMFH